MICSIVPQPCPDVKTDEVSHARARWWNGVTPKVSLNCNSFGESALWVVIDRDGMARNVSQGADESSARDSGADRRASPRDGDVSARERGASGRGCSLARRERRLAG